MPYNPETGKFEYGSWWDGVDTTEKHGSPFTQFQGTEDEYLEYVRRMNDDNPKNDPKHDKYGRTTEYSNASEEDKKNNKKNKGIFHKRDARVYLARQLEERLGISYEQALGFANDNRSSTQLQMENNLVEWDVYKDRFIGNEMRRKAGLDILPEAEYLALEKSYRDSLSRIDVPKGFGDEYKDFAEYIAADISGQEFEDRITEAENIQKQWDPDMKKAMMNVYGLNKGDLVAFALDPDKALHAIQRKMKNINIAEDAIEYGFEEELGKNKSARRFLNKLSKEAPDSDYEEIFREQAQYGGAYAAINRAQQGTGRSFKQQVKGMAGIDKEGKVAEQVRRKRLRDSLVAKFSGSSGVGPGKYGAGEFESGF